MEQQVGVFQLLQGRVEGVHQMVRQLGNEANGIGKNNVQILGHRKLPGGGIQRIKQPVIGRDPRPCQLIQKGGFACVGIAHNRHHRHGVFHPVLPLDAADLPHLLQLRFQPVDPLPDVAAVRFQLGLTGATGADAAALSGKAGAHTGKPGQQIFILSQFHLQAALLGLGPLGEDVQNQRAAVQHRHADDLLQRPDIAGRQLIIENNHSGRSGFHQHFNFQCLALTDKRMRIGGMAVLQHLTGTEAACGLQQGFQLLNGFVGCRLLFLKTVRVQAHQHCPLLYSLLKTCFHKTSAF